MPLLTVPFIAARLRPALIPLIIVTGLSSSEPKDKTPCSLEQESGKAFSINFNIIFFTFSLNIIFGNLAT